jgi:acetyltransferase-like isoleucine patch superfamily enzyme
MMRFWLNRLYTSRRGLAAGIDPRLETRALLGAVAEKATQRARAVVRGFPGSYLGRRSKVRGRNMLRLGRDVVIGDDVSIVAYSVEGVWLADMVTIDRGSILRSTAVIRNLGTGIRVGARTSIGLRNVLLGQGGIDIGEDCLLGPNVSIFSENHEFRRADSTIREQGEIRQRTVIGDNVWIGAGATVLAGVHVGSGAVVAAGAVVSKDVEPNSLVGGVPARHLRSRTEVASE